MHGVAVGGVAAHVARLFEGLGEQGGQAFEIGGGCGFCGDRMSFGGGVRFTGRDRTCRPTHQLIETDGDRLAEVQGEMARACVLLHGDGEEKVAVAQLFVAEAGLLGAEEQGDAAWVAIGACAAAKFGADAGCGFGQREQGVLQVALADGGGPDDQGAVGDGLGEAGAGDRIGEDLGGVDSGARALEGDGEIVDHAQMAEAEVVHGAGGCADVVGVARADQDDVDAVKLFRGRHRVLL